MVGAGKLSKPVIHCFDALVENVDKLGLSIAVRVSVRSLKELQMAKLTAKARKAIPSKSFAGPNRSYPIEDRSHARNALSRVSAFGSPKLKAQVRAKVASRYPGIKQSKRGK